MILSMINKKCRFKALAAVLSIMFIFLGTSFDALGAGYIDTGKPGQLTITYGYGGKPLAGAGFNLYRVADVTRTGGYVLTGGFKDCPVELTGLDSTGWMAAANTLYTYVIADKLEPLRTDVTDAQGSLCFDGLETGLYLVRADDLSTPVGVYSCAPFLVSLPSLDEDDVWEYAPQVSPKTTAGEPEDIWTNLTVVKVWNDGTGHIYRPQSVSVTLLKDGEPYSHITLSSETYWRHTWTGLKAGHTWTVVEDSVPSPYTVTYTQEGAVYTITNSTRTSTGGGGGGGGGGNRHSTPPVKVTIPEEDVPKSNIEIPEEDVPKAGLPQTGLLWWPVPYLAMAGLLLLGIGYKDKYSGKRTKDEK